MRCPLVGCRTWSPNAVSNANGYAKLHSRSHDAMIRVFDEAGNIIGTHEHAGNFKEYAFWVEVEAAMA
jgi:hypothetical protein